MSNSSTNSARSAAAVVSTTTSSQPKSRRKQKTVAKAAQATMSSSIHIPAVKKSDSNSEYSDHLFGRVIHHIDESVRAYDLSIAYAVAQHFKFDESKLAFLYVVLKAAMAAGLRLSCAVLTTAVLTAVYISLPLDRHVDAIWEYMVMFPNEYAWLVVSELWEKHLKVMYAAGCVYEGYALINQLKNEDYELKVNKLVTEWKGYKPRAERPDRRIVTSLSAALSRPLQAGKRQPEESKENDSRKQKKDDDSDNADSGDNILSDFYVT